MSGKSHEDIQKMLSEKYACFVLITCDAPRDDGNMNVEMSYAGDPALASYLVEGAGSYFEDEDSCSDIPKNVSL